MLTNANKAPTSIKREDYFMQISNDIRYVGVNDHQIDLFEGQYIVPNGMAYGSLTVEH